MLELPSLGDSDGERQKGRSLLLLKFESFWELAWLAVAAMVVREFDTRTSRGKRAPDGYSRSCGGGRG
jgi:hypothetical protein